MPKKKSVSLQGRRGNEPKVVYCVKRAAGDSEVPPFPSAAIPLLLNLVPPSDGDGKEGRLVVGASDR